MPPVSILFANNTIPLTEPCAAPEFFADLALDQIVAAVIAGREGYDLFECISG